jgi:hypothetical protein
MGDAPLLLLGAAGKVITAEGSALSSETISQVDDPAEVTADWLLDSPLRGPSPCPSSSPVAGLGGKGLGLAQPCAALEVMCKSLAVEAAKELAVDLRQEATTAVSLVRGKRTKVVTTETILAIKDKCNNSEIVIHFLLNKVPNFGPK